MNLCPHLVGKKRYWSVFIMLPYLVVQTSITLMRFILVGGMESKTAILFLLYGTKLHLCKESQVIPGKLCAVPCTKRLNVEVPSDYFSSSINQRHASLYSSVQSSFIGPPLRQLAASAFVYMSSRREIISLIYLFIFFFNRVPDICLLDLCKWTGTYRSAHSMNMTMVA